MFIRMSPNKRRSSRSPEGASHQRKAPRNDSMSTSNGSRKNSNANANIVDASADPRQNRGSAATVRSPVSTNGSTYQDAASSRSTPRPANLKDSSAMAISQNEVNGIQADEAEMIPLLGPLSMLLAHVRAESALQVSQKLGRIQQELAAAEYQNMKNNFSKFPSIEEGLKKGRFAADQEVAKLERKQQLSMDAQPSIAKSLAAAFLEVSSRAEKARHVPEVSPDAVSREEFKSLQDVFTKQQAIIAKQQQDISDLHNSHAEAKMAALRATEQANTTERDMKDDVARLDNDVECLGKAMQLHSDEMVRTALSQMKEQLGVQVTRFDHEVRNAVTETTERLGSQDKVLSQLSNTVKAATTTVSGAQNRLTKLEERLTATKNEVGRIGANEQRAVTQRFEDYDQNLNNLQSLVEPMRSEIARVREELAQTAQKIKDAPKPVTTTLSSDQAVTSTATDDIMVRVDDALAKFKFELEDDAEARDGVMADVQDEQKADLERTKEQLASVAQKVEELEKQTSICSSDIKQLEQTTDEKHAQTGAAHESMRGAVKTIQSNMEMLQAKTTSLSDTVAALGRRPVPTAQMPAPAAQDTTQFRQVSMQSPRAANSRSGSASGSGHANGIHSPRNPAGSLGLPNGSPAAPIPRDIDVLTNQIRGLSGTVGHLKQRMDNLTTDEVVKSMVDQFGQIFPEAKNFQTVAGALQAYGKLEARLDITDSKVDVLQSGQNELCGKLDKLTVSSVQERDSKVEEAVTMLRKDVEVAIGDARHEFEKVLDIQTNFIVDVRHRVEALANTAFD